MEEFDFSVPNNQLVKFFEDAENELSRMFADVGDDYRRSRLLELQANTRTIMETLRRQSTRWSGSVLPAIYQRSLESTFNDLIELGMSPTAANANFQRINVATVEALVSNSTGDLVRAVNEAERNLNRRMRGVQLAQATEQAFDRSLAVSALSGEGVKQAAERVADIINKPMVTLVNGRQYRTSHYSRLVAVTRTREASSYGVKNTMVHNGEDLVMVSSHPHKKDICTPFDGKIFSISGTSKVFPPIDRTPNSGPPFHPFCKHVLLPFVEELADPEEIEAGMGVDKKFLDPSKKASEINRLAVDDKSLKQVERGFDPSI